MEHVLRDFGLILGAGLVSQLIATVIKIPQMGVLVAAGGAPLAGTRGGPPYVTRVRG